MKSVFKRIVNDMEVRHPQADNELMKTQQCLINMLQEISVACEKHGIRPFLVYGSLLGKVRHNGFIPWDDDLDIGMLRDEYDRFVSVFDEELSDRYVISTPNAPGKAFYRFMQVGRKGTKRVPVGAGREGVNPDEPTSHLFIDIFPFDYVPRNIAYRAAKGLGSEIAMMIAGCVDFDVSSIESRTIALFKRSVRGRMELRSRNLAHKLFSFRSADSWYHIADKKIRYNRETDLLVSATGPRYYFGGFCPKNYILPLNKTDFCGVPIYIPGNSGAVLTLLYGDFMTLPPEDQRQCHSASSIEIEEGLFE